ncbi:MAG: hypothetical protein P8P91_03880, partial [Pseudomonadales bacterium]|nr:hypothetical protein [Pseudomonadales bacterium]
ICRLIFSIHCWYLEYSVGKLLFKQESSNAGVWKAAYNGSRSSVRRPGADASSRAGLLAVGTVSFLTVFIVCFVSIDGNCAFRSKTIACSV